MRFCGGTRVRRESGESYRTGCLAQCKEGQSEIAERDQHIYSTGDRWMREEGDTGVGPVLRSRAGFCPAVSSDPPCRPPHAAALCLWGRPSFGLRDVEDGHGQGVSVFDMLSNMWPSNLDHREELNFVCSSKISSGSSVC